AKRCGRTEPSSPDGTIRASLTPLIISSMRCSAVTLPAPRATRRAPPLWMAGRARRMISNRWTHRRARWTSSSPRSGIGKHYRRSSVDRFRHERDSHGPSREDGCCWSESILAGVSQPLCARPDLASLDSVDLSFAVYAAFCSSISPAGVRTGSAIQAMTSARNEANARNSICCPPSLVLVRDFAVLRGVEPERFLVLAHAQPAREIDDLDDDRGHDDGVDPRRGDRDELDRELAGIAVEQAVLAGSVDRGGGKQSGRDRAPSAADAVTGPHVEGGVDLETRAELHRE